MKLPAVLIDANGHTAIAALHPSDADTAQLVRLGQDQLTILFTSVAAIKHMGFKPMADYPVEKAAAKFLSHKAGVSFAARQMLEQLARPTNTQPELRPTPAAGLTKQQDFSETTNMTIEQNLARLADAQEKTAEHLSAILAALLSRNELLASTGAKLLADTAAPGTAPTQAAEVAEDKPKRTRRTKEQIAADEAAAAAAATPAAEPEPEQAAEAAPVTEPEAAPAPTAENDDSFEEESFDDPAAPVPAPPRTREDVQKLFGRISQLGDISRNTAIATMKSFGEPGQIKNISTIPEEKLGAVYAALDKLLTDTDPKAA